MHERRETAPQRPRPDEALWMERMWDIDKGLQGNTLGNRSLTDDEINALVNQADAIAEEATVKYGEHIHHSLKADLEKCALYVAEKNIDAPHLKNFVPKNGV